MMPKETASLSLFFNELLRQHDVQSNDVEIVNDGFLMTPKKRARQPPTASCSFSSFSSCSTCSTYSSSGYGGEPALATIAECCVGCDDDCSCGEDMSSSRRWNNPTPPSPGLLRIPERPASDRSLGSFNSSNGSLNSSCESLSEHDYAAPRKASARGAEKSVSMPPVPPQRRTSFEAERENPFRLVRPSRRRSFDDRSQQGQVALRGVLPPNRRRSFDEKTTKFHSKTIHDIDGTMKSPVRKVSRIVSFDDRSSGSTKARVMAAAAKGGVKQPTRSASFDEKENLFRTTAGLAPPVLSKRRVLSGSSSTRMPFTKIQSCVDKTQRWLNEIGGQRISMKVATLMTEFSYFCRKEFGIPVDRFCYGAVICNLAAYTWQWENKSQESSKPTSSCFSYKLPQQVFERRHEVFGDDEPFILLENGAVNEVRIRDTDQTIPKLTSKWFLGEHYRDYFALPNVETDGDAANAKGGLSWATKASNGFSSEEIVYFRSIHPIIMGLIHLNTKDLVIKTLTEELKRSTTTASASATPSADLDSALAAASTGAPSTPPIPRNLVFTTTASNNNTTSSNNNNANGSQGKGDRFGSRATDKMMSRPSRRASLF